ncbi:hypothetical protein BT63DRAFT_237567 [Microthyrium microscopicum]|uniref:Uncharacterized protein n=1 Tax=Microthyrium microscopicum TaxID=703497 RepID=A0A6A6UG56_9PEZI|nr:hypothetical protein BT63DRAFT_237567 [Microthyrium microscopicum]
MNWNSKAAPTGPKFDSGAEQDRYGSFFGLGSDGLARIRKAATYQGVGAEQDRYGSHFSLDSKQVRKAADSVLQSGRSAVHKDITNGNHWLGYDGRQVMKGLLNTGGVGAEQERYGAHFGVDSANVRKFGHRVADGIEKNDGVEHMG